MNRKVLILLVVLFSNLLVLAQTTNKGNYYKELLKLSNAKSSFGITGPVRIKDSSGKVISVKTLVELENGYMKKLAAKYGKKLIPELIDLLSDTIRDWAANIFLYALTETSAVTIKYYSSSKIKEWRSIRKEVDVAKWKSLYKRQNE
jgi:hypothetical protein